MSDQTLMDAIVKPLVAYIHEVERLTGFRPKIEVTVDVPVLLELAQWPLVRPGGDPLASLTIADDITIKPPDPVYAGATLTYRDVDGKVLHTATVDPNGRASISIIDD